MSTTKRRRPKGSGGVRNRGTERHPRWFGYFTVSLNGRRRQVSGGPFERKKEAEAWLGGELGRVQEGRAVIPDRAVTLSSVAQDWLAVKRHSWEPNYVANVASLIETRVAPTLGDRRVAELRPAHIAQALDTLRRGLSGRRALSETSLQHTYAALRSMLDWAVRQRLIVSNPAVEVERPRRQRTPMKVWTPVELARFLTEVSSDRLYPLFRLASHTGMRRSELLGLVWSAVDLDAAVVSVARRRVRVGYQMMEREGTKTVAGSRAVDLDAGTVAALKAWRAAQAAERLAWGSAWVGSDLVFTREDGTAVHADYLTQRFRRLIGRAQVPAIRFHDVRHIFATLSLAAGEPPHVVAQRIGHASPSITLSIYGHVLPAQGQQAAARFAALVDGGEARRIAAWEQAAGMLRLDGSDTVVACGSRVRHQLMVAAHDYYIDAGMSDVEFAARLEVPARATTAASWWIDQRQTAPADLEELLTDKAEAAESDTENPH